jgi:predicted TIM-barrel fold metal-dependent hydrolase
VKVSGIYRLEGSPEQNLAFAAQALCALEAHYGAQRLMWGSDWPHTQHESAVSFGTAVSSSRPWAVRRSCAGRCWWIPREALFGFE